MPKPWSDTDELYEAIRNDPNFDDLRRGRNPLVPGEGAQPAPVMIVGEAPGADEVMALRPFVGASGKVLRQLMAIADLRAGRPWVFREGPLNCWLTNVVKYRPPRNRTPTLVELMHSRPYLMDEWRLVGKPSVIIAVGAPALTAIRGQQTPISKYAGKPLRQLSGRVLWPMYHPAFGLRGSDQLRATIESHWEALAEWLNENRQG